MAAWQTAEAMADHAEKAASAGPKAAWVMPTWLWAAGEYQASWGTYSNGRRPCCARWSPTTLSISRRSLTAAYLGLVLVTLGTRNIRFERFMAVVDVKSLALTPELRGEKKNLF